jgi:hypothetical protein
VQSDNEKRKAVFMNEKVVALTELLESIHIEDLKGMSEDDADSIEHLFLDLVTNIALAGVHGEEERKRAADLLPWRVRSIKS